MVMIPSFAFLAFGLVVGYITDKKGQKGIVIIAAFLFLSISHFIFVSLDECPVGETCKNVLIPIILISLSNMMIQLTLYPQVNYLVKEKYFGTAYGIIESSCNSGLFLGSLGISSILNNDTGRADQEKLDIAQFDLVHSILLCLAFFSFVLSIILNLFDIRISKKNALNSVITWRNEDDDNAVENLITSGFNSVESMNDIKDIVN